MVSSPTISDMTMATRLVTDNPGNGTRSKTVVTEARPVEIDVPRDRDASFESQIVRRRQRRLNGVEDLEAPPCL
jgi:transposase-like protein